jgi:putative Holliday junction resolvase
MVMTFSPNDKEEIILGIDWGEARFGLALGNAAAKIASPLKTVATIDDIKKVIAEEGIEKLVIGEPVNSQAGGLDPNFSEFLRRIAEETKLPVSLVDERFSSQAADSLDPKARKEGNRDAIAAMVILQSYFDSLD